MIQFSIVGVNRMFLSVWGIEREANVACSYEQQQCPPSSASVQLANSFIHSVEVSEFPHTTLRALVY